MLKWLGPQDSQSGKDHGLLVVSGPRRTFQIRRNFGGNTDSGGPQRERHWSVGGTLLGVTRSHSQSICPSLFKHTSPLLCFFSFCTFFYDEFLCRHYNICMFVPNRRISVSNSCSDEIAEFLTYFHMWSVLNTYQFTEKMYFLYSQLYISSTQEELFKQMSILVF